MKENIREKLWERFTNNCVKYFGPLENEHHLEIFYDYVPINCAGPICNQNTLIDFVHIAFGDKFKEDYIIDCLPKAISDFACNK